MQEHSGGFVSHMTSSCTAGVTIEAYFYSTTWTPGAGSISISARWSFSGQLYPEVDCTPGGTGPIAWADGYVAVRLWDVSTASWYGFTVTGGSFGSTLSGCTAGQTNSYSQFYTVQAETATQSFSSLGGDFEVFSTFVISNGGSTPSVSLASRAGGCSGLDGINNTGMPVVRGRLPPGPC
jgi:hypothetical protein